MNEWLPGQPPWHSVKQELTLGAPVSDDPDEGSCSFDRKLLARTGGKMRYKNASVALHHGSAGLGLALSGGLRLVPSRVLRDCFDLCPYSLSQFFRRSYRRLPVWRWRQSSEAFLSSAYFFLPARGLRTAGKGCRWSEVVRLGLCRCTSGCRGSTTPRAARCIRE